MKFLVTSPLGHRIIGSLLLLAVVFVVSQLVIVGFWHRDNNYGVRPGDYKVRTISAAEFAELAPENQKNWTNIPNADAYLRIVIRNPFVFSHVRSALVPMLVFALAALVFHVRSYKSVATNASPTVVQDGEPVPKPTG